MFSMWQLKIEEESCLFQGIPFSFNILIRTEEEKKKKKEKKTTHPLEKVI